MKFTYGYLLGGATVAGLVVAFAGGAVTALALEDKAHESLSNARGSIMNEFFRGRSFGKGQNS